jgi:hypothetical protein
VAGGAIVGAGSAISWTRGAWPSRSPNCAAMKASSPRLAVVSVGSGSSTSRARLLPSLWVIGTTMPKRALAVTVGSGSSALLQVSPEPEP